MSRYEQEDMTPGSDVLIDLADGALNVGVEFLPLPAHHSDTILADLPAPQRAHSQAAEGGRCQGLGADRVLSGRRGSFPRPVSVPLRF